MKLQDVIPTYQSKLPIRCLQCMAFLSIQSYWLQDQKVLSQVLQALVRDISDHWHEELLFQIDQEAAMEAIHEEPVVHLEDQGTDIAKAMISLL